MMRAIQLSNAPTVPLRKGRRIEYTTAQAYLFIYNTAPTSHALSDITRHEDVIGGLSRLDADCNLSKKIRKLGRHLHSIIDVRRLH